MPAFDEVTTPIEASPDGPAGEDEAAVDLYWLPLGAGGHCVRLNGRVFEAVSARYGHRPARDLYHSALEVRIGPERFVIEMAPVWNERAPERGVVAEGAVGTAWARRCRLFRYEIRRWRDGRIPDLADAVDSPRRLSEEVGTARLLLDLAPAFPAMVWGRDEFGTGDMWNSNSLTAWLIVRSGIDARPIHPPVGGRAPGWHAGVVVGEAQRARTPGAAACR